MTITEFIEARLAENESVAKEAALGPGRHWDYSDGGQGRERDGILWDEDHANVIGWLDDHLACAIHAARHDPARIQREIEAKRAILALHHPTRPHPELGFTYPAAANFCGYDGPGDNWQAEQEPDHFPDALWPCWTIRYIAAIDRDHPDYDPSWAPERAR